MNYTQNDIGKKYITIYTEKIEFMTLTAGASTLISTSLALASVSLTEENKINLTLGNKENKK